MTGKRRRGNAALIPDQATAAHPGPGHADQGAAGPLRKPAKRQAGLSAVSPSAGSDSPASASPASPSPARRAAASAVQADAAASAGQLGQDAGSAGYVLPEDAVVRRTKDGWRVGSDELPDLTCAMILADLIAAETGMTEGHPAKPVCEATASENGRLRTTVGQLEHALLTRIRVEQAIGVLAERHRIKPRQAFEQLRDAARSRGRKVIDIAGDVVASATNPLLQLPDELSRPRSGPRRAARQPFGAQ
jgi:hypothetical protein